MEETNKAIALTVPPPNHQRGTYVAATLHLLEAKPKHLFTLLNMDKRLTKDFLNPIEIMASLYSTISVNI